MSLANERNGQGNRPAETAGAVRLSPASIYLRPLREEDALVSYKWRNDPEIWQYTASRPDLMITPEIESEWIRRVLGDTSSLRFAICLAESGEYIGNIQLTDIFEEKAQMHIFIGEKKYWGRGVATRATELVLDVAFSTMQLKKVFLEVHNDNSQAIKTYVRNGFSVVSRSGNTLTMMVLAPARCD
jgi:RimJ/RimL family protein N-acetyltransferase